MKKETMQNKLAELLGLDQFKVETKASKGKKSEPKDRPYIGVTEDEIQSFRAAQGLVYFLQAPELFTARTCPHCHENFLVSRQFVAFCSYTCIRKDLENKGIRWSKGEDIEALVRSETYEGNEPIWIRNLDRLREVLETLPESQLLLASSQGQAAS
jgi:endogenous inhibitor of DNA gyrase (YacG/DUF329 family)